MARGGYGSGSGVPLHARTRPSALAAQPVPEPTASTGPPDCPARHCWVSVPVDGSRPRPALLLEWRKVEKGRWEGRVVYAAELRSGRWASVEEWLPAELLSGAD
jgi:hypothetical protein